MKISKILNSKILNAGSVDYDEYIKAHPKSKKQRNDPIFKSDKQESKAAPASAKPASPSAPAWHKKNPNLHPTSVKGVGKALDLLNKHKGEWVPTIEKSLADFKKGKITREQFADVCEDENYHSIAALLRSDKDTDVHVIHHTEQLLHDRDPMDSYDGEVNEANSASYEATSAAAKHKNHSSYDKQRHLGALNYLQHHNLLDSDTGKRLLSLVEADTNASRFRGEQRESYRGIYQKMMENWEKQLKEDKKELSYTSKTRSLEDKMFDYNESLKSKKMYDELGKKLGLV